MRPIEKEVADLYSRLWHEMDTIRSPKVISQFLYNVGLPPEWFKNKLCLDVGCGSGTVVWALQQLGATCHACDLDSSDLRLVRERLGDGENVLLASASAMALPYASDTFEFVHCNGVLHHTTDPRQGFAELVRVTRPGGVLFVGLYGKGGLFNGALRFTRAAARFIPYRWTEAAITPLLKRRTVPNSYLPAKVSILDNLYVPIRERFSEREIRRWFSDAGFEENTLVRTRATVYDHRRRISRLVFGEGYLQLRGHKSWP